MFYENFEAYQKLHPSARIKFGGSSMLTPQFLTFSAAHWFYDGVWFKSFKNSSGQVDAVTLVDGIQSRSTVQRVKLMT
jgi:hypothetical protein